MEDGIKPQPSVTPKRTLLPVAMLLLSLVTLPSARAELLVAAFHGNEVLGYDEQDGSFRRVLIPRPAGSPGSDAVGLALAADGTLYVGRAASRKIERYRFGGAKLDDLVTNLNGPIDQLVFGPDRMLYVSMRAGQGGVHRFDPSKTHSGDNPFVANKNKPVGIAFDPGGDLYVSENATNRIRKYIGPGKPEAGRDLGVFADAGAIGVRGICNLASDRQGNIYVAGFDSNNIGRFDKQGQGTVFATGGKLSHPFGVEFGPDDVLYVSAAGSGDIVRCDHDGQPTVLVHGDGNRARHPCQFVFTSSVAPLWDKLDWKRLDRLQWGLCALLRGQPSPQRIARAKQIQTELADLQNQLHQLAALPSASQASEVARLQSSLEDLPRFLDEIPPLNEPNPYDSQVAENLTLAQSADTTSRRIRAIEALGFLRAYQTAGAMVPLLGDAEPAIRRQATQTLAWCGGRAEVPALLEALDDTDWIVRQSAAAALNNLTGMELSFDALAMDRVRQKQAEAWRDWWQTAPEGKVPAEVVALAKSENLDQRLRAVRALGALGGERAAEIVVAVLGASESDDQHIRFVVTPRLSTEDEVQQRIEGQTAFHVMQAGLRALGRLRDGATFPVLVEYLNKPFWTRYAADALGDYGGHGAVSALLSVLPRASTWTIDESSAGVHPLPEAAYAVTAALSRLPTEGENLLRLAQHAPVLLRNLPAQNDRAIFFEREAIHIHTAHLLERVGMRQPICDELLNLCAESGRPITAALPAEVRQAGLAYGMDALPWLCAEQGDAAELIKLLTHRDNRLKIMAVKTLIFLDAAEALPVIVKQIEGSKAEAEYGYCAKLQQEEYNDPPWRWRIAFVEALGRLGASDQVPLLIRMTNDEKTVLDVRYAAADALARLATPAALRALQEMAIKHDFHSIRLIAREALNRHGMSWAKPPRPGAVAQRFSARADKPPMAPQKQAEGIVFVKGDLVLPNMNLIDFWRQAYIMSDNGPEYRPGRNLFVLAEGEAEPLTDFPDGYVASPEVSYDGRRVIFARRGQEDPWWHLFEIGADGAKGRQLTFGPYHDVNPNYLGDGRIIFASTRLGARDEYHAYPCTGLTVMNPDGSDIHVIGMNVGRDSEPAVAHDGRILFNRLDAFYGNLKTEQTIQAVRPDGTANVTLYGPERRRFWALQLQESGENWFVTYGWPIDRWLLLHFNQPQPMGSQGGVLCCSVFGLINVGQSRYTERFVHGRDWAVTTPFPLDAEGRRFVCAASPRPKIDQIPLPGSIVGDGTQSFHPINRKYPRELAKQFNADLGLYTLDTHSGQLELLYHDPEFASFEPRPLAARPRPPVMEETIDRNSYTGTLLCQSARISREARVGRRGKWLRLIDGKPIVARHSKHDGQVNVTQQWGNPDMWNHQSTLARVLGTVPLAADGSFYVEVPADHLLQCQVLDADRQVVGNQLVWMYARPGETRSCVGCHEDPDSVARRRSIPIAAQAPPVPCLPIGGEFAYEAKVYRRNESFVPDAVEERLRTTQSLGRLSRP